MDGAECLRYIQLLRDDPDAVRAEPWTLDWRLAPRVLKRYSGGTRIPLAGPSAAGQEALHRLLFFSAGYVSVYHSLPPAPSARAARAIASGGGLYPTEVYLLTREGWLFHYDASAHALVAIKSDDDLRLKLWHGLGLEGNNATFAFAVVVTVVFGRSYFKYADFSYLLSAADAGVMLGRIHRLARLEFGGATIHFDFNDGEINDLLDVDGKEESAYAVTLIASANGAEVCLPGAAPVFERARALPDAQPVTRTTLFDDLHQGIVDQGAVLSVPKKLVVHHDGARDPAQLAGLCRTIPRRRSLGFRFSGRSVDIRLVREVIREVVASISDLHASSVDPDLPTLDLYVTALHISDAPSGLYRLERNTGTLVCLVEGNRGKELQSAQRSSNINVDLAAFVVHCVSDRDLGESARMNRSYRVQQMIAGAAMDYIMLASCARGLVAHPVLGFRGSAIDHLYELDASGRASVAQVCVGWVRGATGIDCPIAF